MKMQYAALLVLGVVSCVWAQEFVVKKPKKIKQSTQSLRTDCCEQFEQMSQELLETIRTLTHAVEQGQRMISEHVRSEKNCFLSRSGKEQLSKACEQMKQVRAQSKSLASESLSFIKTVKVIPVK